MFKFGRVKCDYVDIPKINYYSVRQMIPTGNIF